MAAPENLPRQGEPAGLQRLERQVERSQFLMHSTVGEQSGRLREIEAVLYGLIDVLAERGIASPQAVQRAAFEVRAEMEAHGETSELRLGLRVDDGPPAPPRAVNCAERLSICKAVCCSLDFALSAPEVEAGRVKWDLGRPYFIRQEADGRCCHLDPLHGGCGVYADRPRVCRQYSCEGDARIWSDFDRMVLNQAWVDAHLAAPRDLRLRTLRDHRPPSAMSPSQDRELNDRAAGRTTAATDFEP